MISKTAERISVFFSERSFSLSNRDIGTAPPYTASKSFLTSFQIACAAKPVAPIGIGVFFRSREMRYSSITPLDTTLLRLVPEMKMAIPHCEIMLRR